MTLLKLGQLTRIHDLRQIWQSEARDFTPWLAEADNLTMLGDSIGLDLELEAVEKSVGPFRADILCQDTATDSWVLIENQLERTDHTHLGQLLTYGAGLDALTIVWIAQRFTEEHRAALDWLNNITQEGFNFFGIEIELYRIGDSPIAPKFNVVSKPNDWTKSVSSGKAKINSSDSNELSTLQERQLAYWSRLRDYIQERSTLLKPRQPAGRHWYPFAIGRSGFRLWFILNSPKQRLVIQFIITGKYAKPHYHLLHEQKRQIEAEIGQELDWLELPNNKQSQVKAYLKEVDPTNEAQWDRFNAWFLEMGEKFYKAFSPRIKVLNADDYDMEDVDTEFDN